MNETRSRVLVVEDNDGLLIMLRMALGIRHEVDGVRTGGEAVAHYERAQATGQPYHALILDVQLLGAMDGFDVAQAVRAAGDRATKLIFLSAEVDGEGPKKANQLDAAWLQKPEDMKRIEEFLL